MDVAQSLWGAGRRVAGLPCTCYSRACVRIAPPPALPGAGVVRPLQRAVACVLRVLGHQLRQACKVGISLIKAKRQHTHARLTHSAGMRRPRPPPTPSATPKAHGPRLCCRSAYPGASPLTDAPRPTQTNAGLVRRPGRAPRGACRLCTRCAALRTGRAAAAAGGAHHRLRDALRRRRGRRRHHRGVPAARRLHHRARLACCRRAGVKGGERPRGPGGSGSGGRAAGEAHAGDAGVRVCTALFVLKCACGCVWLCGCVGGWVHSMHAHSVGTAAGSEGT